MMPLQAGAPLDGRADRAVFDGLDAKIADLLTSASPIRAIAQVVQTSTADYRKLISLGGDGRGWVSEVFARPDRGARPVAEILPPYGTLYANPSASQEMLDDAKFDLEGWLAQEIATEFGRAEAAAFINGTGINQPKGFLTAVAAAVPDAARAFGIVEYLPTGDEATLGPAPETLLVDVVMALKPGHRQGAVWAMNSRTLAAVRKLKDADGAFLWQSGTVCGQADRLLGYPVVEAADMPDIALGAFPIAFGNFQHGYIIAERFGTHVLRDPYSNRPFVTFYATRRVGGQVLDSEAIKLVKVSPGDTLGTVAMDKAPINHFPRSPRMGAT